MFGFLGRLFGSDKAIEKGVDAISNGIDKLFYTDEEKAENSLLVRQRAGELLINWMAATQGQNIARRLLAIMIAFTWLFMYLMSTALNVSAIWVDIDLVTRIQESAAVIGDRATEMNGAMMLILGFYFAAPHMGSIINVALDKFAGKKEK